MQSKKRQVNTASTRVAIRSPSKPFKSIYKCSNCVKLLISLAISFR
jgi:ribosomal protein L34E